MAILSMSEAARRAGIGRTTLWRKAKSGALSTTTFPDGSPGVDTSELFRVFPLETAEQPAEKHSGTETEQMKQEIKHLHEVIRLKEQVIETQAHALRLLEHRPAPQQDQTALVKLQEEMRRVQDLQEKLLSVERQATEQGIARREAEREAVLLAEQLVSEKQIGALSRLLNQLRGRK